MTPVIEIIPEIFYLVHGKLFDKPVYIIVNHWPSRNNGAKASSHKRMQAAKLVNDNSK